MQNHQNLIFGPVNSRRFGISLGIDLSPNQKQCNFDCLYCELQKEKTVNNQINSIEVKYYIEAVKNAIIKFPEIEVITITANGEPTLYPYLDNLVDQLNKIKQNKKLLILSNSSLINKQSIQQTLLKIDIVKLSLDCITKECFKKLDRIDKDIDYQDILIGLKSFAKQFKNDLVLEILFVDTINNNPKEYKNIYNFLQEINPTRVDIGTIDRPPAYNVKAIEYEELSDIANTMQGLNISIAHKNKISLNKNMSKNEILNLLDKRPQTQEDINNLLDEDSKKIFNNLLKDGTILCKYQAGVKFYKCNKI